MGWVAKGRGLSALFLSLVLAAAACTLDRGDGSSTGGQAIGDDDSAVNLSPLDSRLDILFVIDNSNSMAPIQDELRAHLVNLIKGLTAANLDFRFGVTTTDIESTGNGNQGNIRDLTGLGSTSTCSPTIVTPATDDALGDLSTLVGVGVQGAGNETGVLSAAFALCKGQNESFWDALANRADDDPVKVLCSVVPEAERTCNDGFFRSDASTVLITLSDEGDDAYRSGAYPPSQFIDDCVQEHLDDLSFNECDCRIGWFHDFFEALEQPVVLFSIGPTWQSSDPTTLCDGSQQSYPGPCNAWGSGVCSLNFYQDLACLTGGRFEPLQATAVEDDPQSCALADFGEITASVLQLVGALP